MIKNSKGIVKASAKALIKHNQQYLLLKEEFQGKTLWDLPGGKIEYGETPVETVKRELWEELRIEVEVQRSIGVWWFYSKNHRHQVICQTYLCQPKEGFKIDLTQNPADEAIVGYAWVTREEILSNYRNLLPESLIELIETNL